MLGNGRHNGGSRGKCSSRARLLGGVGRGSEAMQAALQGYGAASAAERRRIQAQVVEACRAEIAGFVRSRVPERQNWPEGEQVGAIGVLVALERLDHERVSEGFSFWQFARPYVRNEIQRWRDDSSERPRNRTRNAGEDHVREMHRTPAVYDDAAGDGSGVHRCAEEVVAEVEGASRLHAFLGALSLDDRLLLIADRRARAGGGVEAGNNNRSRRYLALVDRARRAVRGSEDDEPTAGTDRDQGRAKGAL